MTTPSVPMMLLFTSSLTSHTSCREPAQTITIHKHDTSSGCASPDGAAWVYLCPGDFLQFEELFHQDLVDLHQDHVHPVSVDQRQVSVTLEHTEVSERRHADAAPFQEVREPHPLGLGGLGEDQREETETNLLVLLLTFTHLRARKQEVRTQSSYITSLLSVEQRQTEAASSF